MALPSCLLVSVGGRRSQRPGPSPTLGSLGPSHQRRYKSRVSLRGPPCAHGVLSTPHGEVRDTAGSESPSFPEIRPHTILLVHSGRSQSLVFGSEPSPSAHTSGLTP